jgi:hypothetical protein
MDAHGPGADDRPMHAPAIPSSTDAAALLAAAERLEQAAPDATSPRLVAASLVDVEATLRALDRTCLAAASALIPRPEGDDRISARYAAAAERWDDGQPPSYERQAQILAGLHDSGATLRAAAECCRRARTLLETTIRA